MKVEKGAESETGMRRVKGRNEDRKEDMRGEKKRPETEKGMGRNEGRRRRKWV